jgi:hypothetical protein
VRPASSYSLLFGILAVLGLPLTVPVGSHFNPLVLVVAPIAALGIICGVVGLVRPGVHRGRAKAIAGILCCLVCLIVCAATWPRGGRSPESHILGDIRTVLSAQDAYKSANGGHYGTLECLSKPSACVPGYPEAAPTFLDSALASGQPQSGYERHFIAGPPAGKGLSTSSMTSYAYVAVPLEPGESGVRGFCGDSGETICATSKGRMPQVKDGRCVTDVQDPKAVCSPLR